MCFVFFWNHPYILPYSTCAFFVHPYKLSLKRALYDTIPWFPCGWSCQFILMNWAVKVFQVTIPATENYPTDWKLVAQGVCRKGGVLDNFEVFNGWCRPNFIISWHILLQSAVQAIKTRFKTCHERQVILVKLLWLEILIVHFAPIAQWNQSPLAIRTYLKSF